MGTKIAARDVGKAGNLQSISFLYFVEMRNEHVPPFVICLCSQFHTLGTFYSDTYINV
jgi:hypothetical protein